MKSKFLAASALLVGLFAVALAPMANAAPILVALSGTAAPGGSGGNYSGFYNAPVLNGAGQVAFTTNLSGGSSTGGIFTGTPGSLQAAALQGNAAPAGGNYDYFTDPVLNGAGQVVFIAGLTAGSFSEGLFAGAPGSLQAAALQGTAAPDGGNYSFFASPPVLNGAGQVGFYAGLNGGSSSDGLFAGTPGSLQAVALVGAAAPAGGNYNGFSIPVLNGAGQVAFFAGLTGGSSPSGIFAGVPGSLQAAALEGAASPAGGNYSGFGNPALNGAGQVAFYAGLNGGSSTDGLFAGTPGSLQAVALVGAAAPAGGDYSRLDNPVLNGAGQVAFFAELTAGSSTGGIFTGTPGSIQAAAVQGDAAPGGGNYDDFNNPVLNGAGQVAFLADLAGAGITSANDAALFAGLPGGLMRVVSEGDVIDVDLGLGIDLRTVDDISFLAVSGGQDGKGLSFNDNGLLIYRLTFTDDSNGIFTSAVAVPEPASLGLLAVALLFAAHRRRV